MFDKLEDVCRQGYKQVIHFNGLELREAQEKLKAGKALDLDGIF